LGDRRESLLEVILVSRIDSHSVPANGLGDPRADWLLKAPPEDFLDCYAISRQINSVKFDEAEYNVRAQSNDQLEIHQP
jgi:hypothetical protein